MLEPTPSAIDLRRLPRRLPNDDKIHLAANDCQRDIEAAGAALAAFRGRWFTEDPPRKEEAHRLAAELVDRTRRLQNSARELVRLSSATTE